MGSGLLTLLFGIGGLCAFLLVPTGEDSGSSLAEAIAEAAFLLLIAFFCGLGTWRCYKETQ